MVIGQKKALERLWRDRCSVYSQVKKTDPTTHITSLVWEAVLLDVPCKLSFGSLQVTEGDPVAKVGQTAKLFLDSGLQVPAGSKIVVSRPNEEPRQFTFGASGLAGVFTHHQEIQLAPWEELA